MLKLSVIVPVYNKGQFLARCLDSLIQQTYARLEIICVNDGSTDDSAEILAAYAGRDSRISIISQPNKGLSAARNAGMAAANGDYISFIDPDDYIKPDAYVRIMPLFKIYKNLDIVAFAAKVALGEQGALKLKSDDAYYSTHYKGFLPASPELFLSENLSVCTKIFSLPLIRQNKLYFAEGRHYEDFEFCWKYISNSRNIYFLPDKFYIYLRYKNSIMASTFKGSDYAIDHLYLTDSLFSYFLKTGKMLFFKQTGSEIFSSCFWLAYRHSTAAKYQAVLDLALNIVQKYQLDKFFPDNLLIKRLLSEQLYKYKNIAKWSLRQKLFSVKKLTYKRYISILGIRLAFKRKKYKQLKAFLESK